MKTYKQCCEEVAKKHRLGSSLVTGHRAVFFEEAATMLAEQYVSAVISATINGMTDWIKSDGVIITDKNTREQISNAQIDIDKSGKYQHPSVFVAKRLLNIGVGYKFEEQEK